MSLVYRQGKFSKKGSNRFSNISDELFRSASFAGCYGAARRCCNRAKSAKAPKIRFDPINARAVSVAA